MKNLLIIAFLLLMLNVIAKSATTGLLTLTGIVLPVVNISVSPMNNYNSLDLSDTVANLVVASIEEKSNSISGYEVFVTSVNSGALKNGTEDSLSYTAKYNGSDITLSTSQQKIFETTGGVHTNNHDFSISYTGRSPTNMVAGTYTDDLTFTIQVK